MNLFIIAWKSLKQRALSSGLTGLSVALGVAMMIAVLVGNKIMEDTFNTSGAGYDLVVGPKGGKIEMVLNAIYRISPPIENLPWRFYLDLKNNPNVELAVPLALGDKTEAGAFPILGTTPDYFLLEYAEGRKFAVQGDWPVRTWEAVIGDRVAKVNNWKVGTKFKLVHSGAGMDAHVHDEEFTIVGILAKTGTPNDRTVFCNLNGFYMISGHDNPVNEAIEREAKFMGQTKEEIIKHHEAQLKEFYAHQKEEESHNHGPGEHHHHHHGLIDLQKEVTSVLVRMKTEEGKEYLASTRARNLQVDLQQGFQAMAVNPIPVMRQLLDDLFGNFRLILTILTTLIIIVSGIGIFVSIYNSMSERKREIAIMRALGASRQVVFSIILLESVILCVGGGLLGILLGHGMVILGAPIIERQSGLVMNPYIFQYAELSIIPAMLLMSILVGMLPAIFAYKTDVASNINPHG